MLAKKWACEADDQFKLRKTDESVDICRNQANNDKNEDPCKWCVNAICRGFYYAVRIKVIMDIVYRMW